MLRLKKRRGPEQLDGLRRMKRRSSWPERRGDGWMKRGEGGVLQSHQGGNPAGSQERWGQ